MDIILIRKRLGSVGRFQVSRKVLLAIGLVAFLVLPGTAMYLGYHLGTAAQPDVLFTTFQGELHRQRQGMDRAKEEAQENVTALAVRLGQLQAHVIRMEALGQRLTKMANLDKGEFDFDNPPAQGGPEQPQEAERFEIPDFLQTLDGLSRQIDDRIEQLSVLESMLMNRNLQAEIVPAGRPTQGGWISSFFGMRTDPFNGRREFHQGMDFAGKAGSNVMAVAAGLVTWAGERYGYGNLVEINHGSGYVTRYGHNKEILVKVGDTIKKGKVLAKMGSTGRSTGPHVHFEVLRHGKAVNPAKYIRASR